MHRTQISLEEDQYQFLIQEAHKRKKSLSAIIRQLVTEHFKEKTSANPLEKIAGIAEGDGQAVGKNHNQYLYGKK